MLKSSNRNQFILQGVLIAVILVIIGVILVPKNNERKNEAIIYYNSEPNRNIQSNLVNDKSRNNVEKHAENHTYSTYEDHLHKAHTHENGNIIAQQDIIESNKMGNADQETYDSTDMINNLTDEELKVLEHQLQHEKWDKAFEDLYQEVDKKYPDILELSTLTRSELAVRYPDEDAVNKLKERMIAMQQEFESKLDAIMGSMPLDHQLDYILSAADFAEEVWSKEIADYLVSDFIMNVEIQ